jgi:hypothetical protein
LEKGPPAVPIFPNELSPFTDKLDKELITPCEALRKKGVSELPSSLDTYGSLNLEFQILKNNVTTVDRVITSLKAIKKDLVKFQVEMIDNKKTFSAAPSPSGLDIDAFVSSLVASAKKSAEPADEIEDILPSVVSNWASLHTPVPTVTAMEVADVDDVEMANSAFGHVRSV